MYPLLAAFRDYVPGFFEYLAPPKDADWSTLILYWVCVIGGMTLVASIITAIIVVRMPADYFKKDRHDNALQHHHSLYRWVLIILKNVVGVFLIVFGIIASGPGIPGPGFLTIFIGLVMIDFIPKKKQMMKWLMSWQFVSQPMQAIRRLFGKPPIDLGESKSQDNK